MTAGEGGAAVDLAFKTKYGDGSDAGLALQTDWGFDNPKNDGKVYQTSHLQKGKYKLTAHVYEYDGRGFTGYVAVCKGNEMANTSDIPSKSLANASISGTGDVVVDILVEEPTDVVIGFVCTITVKQGRAKIDNFKLELVEQYTIIGCTVINGRYGVPLNQKYDEKDILYNRSICYPVFGRMWGRH